MAAASQAERTKQVAAGLVFLTLVPVTAHLCFSPLGFNPTDDGFILAYSRRLIEHQVPHRDFISIRPPLSALLHIPTVLLGGDYTILFGRLVVWFQLACKAWLGVAALSRMMKRPLAAFEALAIALVAFVAAAHTFPILPWHTIDGLFMSVLGLWLALRESAFARVAGFAVMGLAYLCKQSFVLTPIFALLLTGQARQVRHWVAIALPGTAYLVYVIATGAAADARLQLFARSEVVGVGLLNYFNKPMGLGLLVGFCAAQLGADSPRLNLRMSAAARRRLKGIVLVAAPLAALGAALVLGGHSWVRRYSFGTFGLLLGAVAHGFVLHNPRPALASRAALLALAIAWCGSLSFGYDCPALGGGMLLAALMCQAIEENRLGDMPAAARVPVAARVPAAALLFALLGSFAWGRTHHIYRDDPLPDLTCRLDGVLPGGRGLRTNKHTHEFLVGLKDAIGIAEEMGGSYAILPDCPAYWVKADRPNPLCIDWPQHIELKDARLAARVTSQLDSLRGGLIVIVGENETEYLATGFVPLVNRYEVVRFVRSRFEKAHDLPHFEVFK